MENTEETTHVCDQEFVKKAKDFAIDAHEKTNHRYDPKGNNMPYSFHLSMVVDQALDFIDLVPEADRPNVIAACWLHDAIEDARLTYNDVKKETNHEVAELAYALTNNKGRTRKERADDSYYAGIRATPHATFVKLCDRLANFKYSFSQGGSMMKKYAAEHAEFKESLFEEQYKPIFFVLDKLADLSKKFTA